MPRPITAHAVVFDCDGTLVATQGVWDRAYATLFAEHRRSIRRADRHRLIGLQLVDLGHALAELLDQPTRHAELAHRIHRMVETNLGNAITPMPGAISLVTELAHTRPIAVASNTPRTIVRAYLNHIGIRDLFTAIVGADDVDHPKPAPDTYLAACAALGTTPQHATAIEDSPTGVAAARAAGLAVIGVPSSPDITLHTDRTYPNLNDPNLRQTLGLTHINRHSA